jgi:acyl carrier protein
MSNIISSRTPEGSPNTCPVCHNDISVEPSLPSGDAPCPNCGSLLWFVRDSSEIRYYDSRVIGPIREKLLQSLSKRLHVERDKIWESASFSHDLAFDSLDIVELVMEFEEEFEIKVPDQEAEKIKTVRDAIEYLVRHGHRRQG